MEPNFLEHGAAQAPACVPEEPCSHANSEEFWLKDSIGQLEPRSKLPADGSESIGWFMSA